MPGLGNGLGLDKRRPTGGSGLLKGLPIAHAAYGLTHLFPAYSGGVILTRNSNNDEGAFTPDEILAGGAISFANEGDGELYWKTLYDLTGNGRHATQTDPNKQGKIVTGGALITSGGKPAIQFNGTSSFLDPGEILVRLSGNNATVVAVSDSSNAPANTKGYIASEGDSIGPYSSNFIFGGDNGGEVLWVNSTEFGSALSASGNQLLSFTYDGSDFQAYINGASSGSAGSATVNSEVGTTKIGSSGDGSTAFSSRKLSTLIIWRSDQTDNLAGIHAAINSYYSIY